MRGVKLFSTSSGIFSKKEIKRKQLLETKKIMAQQKILKQKFLEEERKRKIVNKLRKQHSKEILEIQKEELKKIRERNTKQIPKPSLNSQQKNKVFTKPSLLDLEKYILKLSNNYDQGIHKSKKLYEELLYLGLTDSGLKEFHGETEKKRNKRIAKINETHKVLINILETNKEIERKIELIDEQIKKEQYK